MEKYHPSTLQKPTFPNILKTANHFFRESHRVYIPKEAAPPPPSLFLNTLWKFLSKKFPKFCFAPHHFSHHLINHASRLPPRLYPLFSFAWEAFFSVPDRQRKSAYIGSGGNSVFCSYRMWEKNSILYYAKIFAADVMVLKPSLSPISFSRLSPLEKIYTVTRLF